MSSKDHIVSVVDDDSRELGISEVTLQIHSGKIMEKMKAESLAELVRMAATLGIPVAHSRRARA